MGEGSIVGSLREMDMGGVGPMAVVGETAAKRRQRPAPSELGDGRAPVGRASSRGITWASTMKPG